MRRMAEDGVAARVSRARSEVHRLRSVLRRADRVLAELEHSTPVGSITLPPDEELSTDDGESVLDLVQTALTEHPGCEVEITVSVMAPHGA